MMDGFGGHGWGMGWWWIIGIILIVVVIWMVAKSMNQNNAPAEAMRSRHSIY